MMVTVISTPTASSIRLSIPTIISSTISSSSSSNLNIKASFIPSSSSTRLILLRSKKQSKLGLIRFRKLHVSCGVTEIDQTLFTDTVLKSELPVLVEFVADWCGPCRLISPAIDWASKEYENRLQIVKINHDLNPQLIEEYKVYGLPALMFFKNGKEVPESRREGAMTKAKLKEYIDAFLESMAVF